MCDLLCGPVTLRGHSIPVPISAKNPDTFAPSSDRITGFHPPGGIGVRVGTRSYTEQWVIEMFLAQGNHTSIPVHEKIIADPDFQAGTFDTNLIKRFGK